MDYLTNHFSSVFCDYTGLEEKSVDDPGRNTPIKGDRLAVHILQLRRISFFLCGGHIFYC
jgi:hypothetical protein